MRKPRGRFSSLGGLAGVSQSPPLTCMPQLGADVVLVHPITPASASAFLRPHIVTVSCCWRRAPCELWHHLCGATMFPVTAAKHIAAFSYQEEYLSLSSKTQQEANPKQRLANFSCTGWDSRNFMLYG